MPKIYKYLFFDLDHTLWDFERNAEETKREMFDRFQLKSLGIESYEVFREKYVGINIGLWALYREGKIEKHELNFRRFFNTIEQFGISDRQLGSDMAAFFIEGISSKTYLYPYTRELLAYLFPKYKLYIITNGFEEVQYAKLDRSDLRKYFTQIITSEAANSKKPDPGIFKYALLHTGAALNESLMIGDDLEVDIEGARNFGMDQLFVNHNQIQHSDDLTFEVRNLREICNIL